MGYTYEQLIQSIGTGNVKIIDALGTVLAEFTLSSNITTLEGTAVANDDFVVKANSNQTYPFTGWNGGGSIQNSVNPGSSYQLFDGTTQMLEVDYGSNITTMTFGALTGDDGIIKVNDVDTYPYMRMYGNGNLDMDIGGTSLLRFLGGGSAKIIIKPSDACLYMYETTTPTAIADYGAIYTKNDNKLYFQDGAGTEHEVAFV